MTSERWRKIEELYHAAQERDPRERGAFLAGACRGDDELQREIEVLLAQDSGGNILDSPAAELLTGSMAAQPLSAGDTLGPYEIAALIGAGGMGEVYRARDPRLRRDVALKVLPSEVSRDPARRQRFEREARAVAALNHPNIVAIYDVGEDRGVYFIVTELVDGEPLRAAPLSVRKALEIAIQIASGLDAAHQAGIVHRDLKPANILLARDGHVKILDFGLAKLGPSSTDALETATLETHPGMVMGTPGYMSPEQVKGQATDHRSDIFSFGLILYELLAGQRAFHGAAAEAMAAILNNDPPELPETVPLGVRQIVAGCLEKDPAARFESARDLALTLRAFSSSSSISASVPGVDTAARPARRRWLFPALAASVVALAALSAALYITRPAPLDLSTYKFKPFATDAELESLSSWSRDGKSVVYLKTVDGQLQVMVRSLDAPLPTQLTRCPSGAYDSAPFFSPDGERVYFIASGALRSVAVVGGEPLEVLKAPMVGAALSPDGKTLAFWQRYEEAGKQYGGVWISSPPGASPRKYAPAPFRVETGYLPDYLRFSPDGSRIGLAAFRGSGEAWFWILPWPDGPKAQPHQAFSSYSFRFPPSFDWMPDSRHICLSSEGSLWLGDSRSGKLQRLTASAVGAATEPSVSPGGERVLFTAITADYDMIELPLDGSPPRPLLATARSEMSPSWSAGGDKLAFISDRSGESEIWLRNPSGNWERPAVRQSDFPNDPGQDFQCVALSPDGTRVAYQRHGRLWVSPASGGRVSQAVVGGEREIAAPSWSPDSSSITYLGGSGGKPYVAVTRVGSLQPQFLLPGTADQCASATVWSPDGRWIACGGYNQTVLLVSPDGQQHRSLPSPVPAASKRFVLVWSRDAETIYVASSHTPKARLDAIDVQTGRSRKIVEYSLELMFSSPINYSLSGSLSRDAKSFATTVLNTKSDLWILEGFPQPRRRWF
jgi:serine/threonine protein kinase/Tol biopolymer transport system component